VATDGTGGDRAVSANVPATDMRGSMLKVWLRVQNVEHATSIAVWLGNQGLSNAFKFQLRSGQGQQWITEGDMVAFTVAWSPEYMTSTGFPDRAAIEEVAFHVSDDGSGTPVTLEVGGLALVPEPTSDYPNGLLSFTFDDNWDMMPTVAAAKLAEHEFPATAYVIIDYIDKNDRATHDQLHDLQLHGWDIAVHAFTGAHHDARFPTLPAQVVEDDLVDARAWLMKYGFHGHHHCAYPGGDFSFGGNNVLPIVGRYFTSCRTIYQRQREATPPSDPLKLRVLYVTSGTSRAAVELAIDRAKASHEWIILVFHRLIEGEPTLTTEWKISDFNQIVDKVAASGIDVATVSSALAR
jgi:peptidoglycan/xylan/chitin deacetylase (PgdA/CDA1 family)